MAVLPGGSNLVYTYQTPVVLGRGPGGHCPRHSGCICQQPLSARKPPERGMCEKACVAQTADSVSTGPCRPSFRDSFSTVGLSGSPLLVPPSPAGVGDRPFCSSLASSDTSG